jgi:phosphatidylserine decarboxylase
MNHSRIDNKLPVAKEGIPFILIGCLLTLLLLLLPFYWPACIAAILTIFVISFFRDPERQSNAPESAVLSPADGRVCQISKISAPQNPLGSDAIKISVFMSIFNVHVNRIPMGGTILNIKYRAGKFFSANLEKASEQNESNTLILESNKNFKIAVVQIAGLIARRIACWVEKNDMVRRGQRFGLIRFGSRLDVYLPVDVSITVDMGQKVKSGETVIAQRPQN